MDAIHGSGAFRAFKGTLRRLRLEDAWFAFKNSAFEDMARSWLSEHGFEVNDDRSSPNPGKVGAPSKPRP